MAENHDPVRNQYPRNMGYIVDKSGDIREQYRFDIGTIGFVEILLLSGGLLRS